MSRFYLQDWFDHTPDSLRYWPDRHYVSLLQADENKTFSFIYDDYIGSHSAGCRVLLVHLHAEGLERAAPATQYMMAMADSRGELLEAGKLYKVDIPADMPVKQFWALTVYDRATMSFIYSDLNRTTLSSYDVGKMKKNADGGVRHTRVGPKAPKGLGEPTGYRRPEKGPCLPSAFTARPTPSTTRASSRLISNWWANSRRRRNVFETGPVLSSRSFSVSPVTPRPQAAGNKGSPAAMLAPANSRRSPPCPSLLSSAAQTDGMNGVERAGDDLQGVRDAVEAAVQAGGGLLPVCFRLSHRHRLGMRPGLLIGDVAIGLGDQFPDRIQRPVEGIGVEMGGDDFPQGRGPGGSACRFR